MTNVLITYSTTDGHTRKICERLERVIGQFGHEVILASLHESPLPDPALFDVVVVGASIRYGKHHKAVYDFIKRHSAVLESRPNAFFSVNLVARKAEKRGAETNPYVRKFLRQIPWCPRTVAVFAGKIDYPGYTLWDRKIIQLIMWMTRGPTDPKTVREFTDWEQVEAFGRQIAGAFAKAQRR